MPATQPIDWIPCSACRHGGVGFEAHTDSDAAFMTEFRLGRGAIAAGASLDGDARHPLLITLYSGWALRLRLSPSGQETVLGIALPGDLIGVQTILSEKSGLRLRALTDVTFCQFDPARWRALFAVPSLAERFCRIEALARQEAEERRAAMASLSAAGNLSHFLLGLYDGLRSRKLAREGSFHLPLARNQMAALLGMTTMHLRRTLGGLAEANVLEIRGDRIVLYNLPRMRSLAGNPVMSKAPRPLL